jgi:cobalt-zinc-cadmium efflux system outer membrane protein
MRTRTGFQTLAVMLLSLGSGVLAGCVSSASSSDLARVRDLSRVEAFAATEAGDVDPVADEDARKILREPLDVEAAVRVALLNNRELRASLREMGIARGRLLQAGLLPNPTVEVELLPERNTQLELRAEYDISSAVLAPLRARAAQPELEAARYRAASAVVELGYRVRVAFYGLQAAEQRLGIAQRVLDGFAAGREAARAMFEAGNVAELDLVSEEAACERARITVAQLELDVADEREQLQRVLGVHGADTGWRTTRELSPVQQELAIPEDLESRALRASLDLRELGERLEGLARRSGVVRAAGWLPDVTIDIHGLQGDPEAPSSSPSQGDWRFGAGVSVGVPLFDRDQGTLLSVEAEFDALMERYYGMAVELRSLTREAANGVASAHARARRYQEVIVPAQGRVTAQTLLQYNAMQVGVFQLLSARREELEVQLAYVESLREYWSAVAELDALLAGRRVASVARGTTSIAGGSEPPGGH